jgi:hypothetical protein
MVLFVLFNTGIEYKIFSASWHLVFDENIVADSSENVFYDKNKAKISFASKRFSTGDVQSDPKVKCKLYRCKKGVNTIS